MRHIITVNNKPIDELTLEERKKLDMKIAEAFRKHIGLVIPIYEEDYIEKVK